MIKRKIFYRFNAIKKEHIYLLAIIAFAVLLRTYNLNELTGGDDAQFGELIGIGINSPKDIFYNSFPNESISYGGIKYTRPATVIPLIISTSIFGNTAFALLIPTIISTVLSIILLYLLVGQYFSKKTALYAALLLAASPFYVLYSRNAFLHAQLIALWLGSALFFVIAIKKNKPEYVYISAGMAILNQLTTDFRGLVPLIGLLTFLLLSKPDPRIIKHTIIAAALSITFYFGYILLPYIFYRDPSYISWLKFALLHGAGQEFSRLPPQSWVEVIKSNVLLLIFSPFLGVILVPMIYGLIKIIKNYKKPINCLIITAFSSWIIFIISRQVFFERVVVLTPIFAWLAAVGIIEVEKNNNKIKTFNPIYLFSSILTYLMFIPILLYIFFPIKFAPLFSTISSMNLQIILEPLFILLSVILIWIIATSILKISKKRIRCVRKINHSSTIFILTLMIILPSALVVGHIGEYSREKGAQDISRYLTQNDGDQKFLCISSFYDKAMMYYTKRLCLSWDRGPEIVKKAILNKEVKFIVVDNVYRSGGKKFEERFPELYEYIEINSEDVTEKIPGQINPDKFKVLKLNQDDEN